MLNKGLLRSVFLCSLLLISCSPAYAGISIDPSQKDILTNGLVGYWTFDGPDMDWSQSTAEARDQSGQANHGNAIGGTTATVGKVGQALEFDGSGDYVAGSIMELYRVNKTITAWIKIDTINKINNIFEIGDVVSDISPQTLFQINANNRLASYGTKDGGNLDYLESVETVSANTWYFVTFVNDADNTAYKFYLDGSEVSYLAGTTGTYADRTNTANNYYIGVGYDNDYFDGLIDEVRIYNRALSESEIEQLYNMGLRKLRH